MVEMLKYPNVYVNFQFYRGDLTTVTLLMVFNCMIFHINAFGKWGVVVHFLLVFFCLFVCFICFFALLVSYNLRPLLSGFLSA